MRKEQRQLITKFYDDNIGTLLGKNKRGQDFLKHLLEEGYFDDLPRVEFEANEPSLNPAHANVTQENLEEQLKEGIAIEEMYRMIANGLIKKKILPEMSELDAITLLEEALRQRAVEEWPEEMPEVIYRGVWREPTSGRAFKRNKNGYSAGTFDPITEGLTEKYNFISSEPSVAASYARAQRYDRGPNDMPTNYGDKILKIYTQGLDPKLFCKDKASCTTFGPQYIYKGAIPQEKITLPNGYEVDRISWDTYLSDKLLKDVYIPKHIIDAVRRI